MTILSLILIATLFLIQNTQVANITLLFWTYSLSVSLVVVLMLLIGILVGWFSKSYLDFKKKKNIKQENEDRSF
ncbi:MAG: lipopolysaccharide assembly protein LapA domain-containing protein [Patescibacteria group bacterium]|nr:lipopolysaccharide assembly protein LapA domain-containing protein [Patescibacteria group bacterium]